MQSTLFPHDTVRDQQDQLVDAVFKTIDAGGKLVVHAPTGLGKTAATLAPAIERAIALDKTVVFMTSRLTQHTLALETVSRINRKHNMHVTVVDIIGKKHLCLQPGTDRLGGKEFAEYCKAMRGDGLCEYYERLKQGEQLSATTRGVLVQLGKTAPQTPDMVKMLCAMPDNKVCPYEVSMLLAKDARVIVSDYSYIFNESIRESFLARLNRELADCILVVDEGHNLPERIKELATVRLSTMTIRRAIGELIKHQAEEHKHHLQEMQDALERFAQGMGDERHVTREEFLAAVARSCPVEQLIDDLTAVAHTVREEQRSSSCGTIAEFLTAWSGDDAGYTRILARKRGGFSRDERGPADDGTQSADANATDANNDDPFGVATGSDSGVQRSLFGQRVQLPSAGRPLIPIELRHRCLDPSVVTRYVFETAHSSIIMSGTLTPTDMYAQILGMDASTQLALRSPFPQENRVNLVVPKTTTKFTTRGAQMYDEIAQYCAKIVSAVPGNSAVFFPSYQLLDEIKQRFETKHTRTVFTEHPSFTREEREELLTRFRQYKESGAVLLGVMGGSFSEGIDLPGDELRAVVIVGLPLGRPDLETKALIDHYQAKFGKGWEYGYTFPAFNKTLQSAGRCIRTETDRGAVIFLDERYAWQQYYGCFPREWNLSITVRPEELLRRFFEQRPTEKMTPAIETDD
jgi:DNA excision repair protein ERCC-2